MPEVLGVDERGREALTYLPGRVIAVDGEMAALDVLVSAMRWLRRYHDAVESYSSNGPWRWGSRQLAAGELICHHDFAPYNVAVSSSATGERVVGVFDWDMAGPGTRLEDLAFAAWNWVPLHGQLPPPESAYRLRVMADAYGGVSPRDILAGVARRVDRSIRLISQGQAAGDTGMLNLANVGEPERTIRSVADLRSRLPAIERALAAARGPTIRR